MNVELIVAKTLWGMCRKDSLDAMAAVANVISNRKKRSDMRAHWWGVGFIEVCLKPGVFSCWHPDSDIRVEVERVDESNPRFREALIFAREIIHGNLPDRTKGCDYTHTLQGNTLIPAHVTKQRPLFVHGRHLFYRLES